MPRSAALRAVLFDTRHPEPQNVDAWSVDVASLTDTQLLWIELQDSARQDPVAERLGVPREIMDALRDTAPMPRLVDAGDCFWLRASGIHPLGENGGFEVHAIDLIAGRNFVVTYGNGDAGGPEAVLGRPALRRDLGRLSAASFVAAHACIAVDVFRGGVAHGNPRRAHRACCATHAGLRMASSECHASETHAVRRAVAGTILDG